MPSNSDINGDLTNDQLVQRYAPSPRGPIGGLKDQPLFDLGDVALAPVRGVVGAAQDLWNLGDTVTGGALPDWKENPLGESTSVAGSVLEGISNFAVGFVPVAGWLGKAGKVQKFLGTAKALETGLEGAGLFAKGTELAQAAKAGGVLKGLVGAGVRRSALASAVTGFALFDGHEQRLSNLLEQIPGIQQPVFELLAANEDDTELVGRLKNAVEQAGFGVAFDALFLGIKGVRAARAARAAGKDPEAVAQAVEAATPAQEVRSALKKLDGDESLGPVEPELPTAEEDFERFSNEMLEREKLAADIAATPEAVDRFDIEAQQAFPDLPPSEAREAYLQQKIASNDVPASLETETPEIAAAQEMARDPEKFRHLKKNLAGEAPSLEESGPRPTGEAAAAEATPANVLRSLGLDDAKVQVILQEAKEIKKAGGVAEGALNPRKLSASEALEARIDRAGINLDPFDNSQSVNALIRAGENLFKTTIEEDIKSLSPQTLAAMDNAARTELKDMLGLTDEAFAEKITRNISETSDAVVEVRKKLLFDRMVLKQQGKKTAAIAKEYQAVRSGKKTGNAVELGLELMKNQQRLTAWAAGIKGNGAEMGRTFRAMQRVGNVSLPGVADLIKNDPAELARRLGAVGGLEELDKIVAKHVAAYGEGGADGTARLAALARGTRADRLGRMTLEFWMNSILGHPKTGVVNALGSIMNIVYNPFERMLGAAVIKRLDGAKATAAQAAAYDRVFRDALGQVNELAHGLREFTTIIDNATGGRGLELLPQSGPGFVDSSSRFAPQITATNVAETIPGLSKVTDETVLGKGINFFGSTVRLPSWALGKTDDLLKQLDLRSLARSHFTNEALDKGILAGAEQADYIAGRMNAILEGNQLRTVESVYQQGLDAATKEGIIDPVLAEARAKEFLRVNFDENVQSFSKYLYEHAQEVTYSTPAREGSFTESLQKMTAAHPVLKMVAPFINTPANLLKFTGQRLDAVGVVKYILSDKQVLAGDALESIKSRFLRDMLSGDPARKAAAVGRISAGVLFTTAAVTAASTGVITGAGPKDPDARKALLDSGWLPYAIRTPDGYVQYSRLDPFATFFGLAADVAETAQHSMEDDTNAMVALMHGMATAAAYNFTNKSYLTGVKSALDLMADPVKNAGPYTRRYASAVIPGYVNAVTAAFTDDHMKDVRNILDSIKARIPGASESVPSQRNVLGEPISRTRAIGAEETAGVADFLLPVAYRRTSDDVVSTELARLGYPFSPPRRTVNGQDLSDIPAGDTTAYDRWGELHGTVTIGGLKLRDALRREIRSPLYQRLEADAVDGQLSPRVARINNIIREYRAKAWAQLLRENKPLKDYDKQFTANKMRLKHGLPLSILPQVGQ